MSNPIDLNRCERSYEQGPPELGPARLCAILKEDCPADYIGLAHWFEGKEIFRLASYHYAIAGDLHKDENELKPAADAYLSAILNHFKTPPKNRDDAILLWTKYIVVLWRSEVPASQLSHFYKVQDFNEFSDFVRGWETAYRQRLESEAHLNNEQKDVEIAFGFYANAIDFLLSGKPHFSGVEKLTALYFEKMRQLVGRDQTERYFLDLMHTLKHRKVYKCAKAWDLKNKISVAGSSSASADDSLGCLMVLVAIFKKMRQYSIASTYESRVRTYKVSRSLSHG
ncbi:MAG: hypothetical protein V4492_07450 [Chlamydiota bacterium]